MPPPANNTHAQHPQTASFSINELYYILFRHKWKILICSLIGLLAAAAVFVLTPTAYRSQATLLVRYVTETAAVDPAMTGNRMLTPDSRGKNIINTEMHILTSRAVIGTTIDKIGLEEFQTDDARRGLRERVKAIVKSLRSETGAGEEDESEQLAHSKIGEQVARNLSVSTPRDSNIINIEYSSSRPGLAQLTLQNLIATYLDKHYAIHRALGTYGFLAQQVDQTRSELAQTEDELRALEAKLGFTSGTASEDMVIERRADLQHQLWQLGSELAGAMAESGVFESWLTSGGDMDHAATTPGGTTARSAMASLPENSASALRRRESELLAVYTEGSRPVQDIREQIARLEQQSKPSVETNQLAAPSAAAGAAAARKDTRVEAGMLTSKARIASLQARIAALRKSIELVDEKLEVEKSLEGRITELKRKKEIQEANYRYFSQSLERAKIDASLDAEKLANIGIVQPATYPADVWRSPNFRRNVLGLLAGGILVGLGLAFFTEKFADHSIRHPAELEHALQTPLLLTIPRRTPTRGLLSINQGKTTIRMLPSHEGTESRTVNKSDRAHPKTWKLQSELRPYYEALRDRLLAYGKQIDAETPLLVGITSCKHRSGTTTMAAGLALTLSRNGDGRVLFVDVSDLDHANGHSLLDHPDNVRLADIFSDNAGNTTIMQPNLFVLSANEVSEDPKQVKPSARMEEILEQLKNSDYDYVILDMPPIGETSPTLRMAPLLGGVILVVEAEKVARATAQKARRWLDQAHAQIIGAILNRKKQYIPNWLDQ